MCNTCCNSCPKRDYEACKSCENSKKFTFVITAESLSNSCSKEKIVRY